MRFAVMPENEQVCWILLRRTGIAVVGWKTSLRYYVLVFERMANHGRKRWL